MSTSPEKPSPDGRSPSAGKRNHDGSTPRTIPGALLSDRTRPRIAGSAPKRCRHRRSLSNTPRELPTSSEVKARPMTGPTPSTSKKSVLTRTPVRRWGSPVPVRLNRSDRTHAKPAKVVFRDRKSFASAGEIGRVSKPVRCWTSALNSHGTTSRSGRGYGSGGNSTRSIMLKIAAFPPMPSASVAIASSAKPGLRTRARTAARRSCMRRDRSRTRRRDRSIARGSDLAGSVMIGAVEPAARPGPGRRRM